MVEQAIDINYIPGIKYIPSKTEGGLIGSVLVRSSSPLRAELERIGDWRKVSGEKIEAERGQVKVSITATLGGYGILIVAGPNREAIDVALDGFFRRRKIINDYGL